MNQCLPGEALYWIVTGYGAIGLLMLLMSMKLDDWRSEMHADLEAMKAANDDWLEGVKRFRAGDIEGAMKMVDRSSDRILRRTKSGSK